MLVEVFTQLALGTKVAGDSAVLPNDEARQVRPMAFDVLVVDAVIADFRVRHRDDLPAVAGVGQDLLVTRHRRVEDHFPIDFAASAEGLTGEYGPIFQSKFGNLCHGQAVTSVTGVISEWKPVRSVGNRAPWQADLKSLAGAARYPLMAVGLRTLARVRSGQPTIEDSCCGEQESSFFLALRFHGGIPRRQIVQSATDSEQDRFHTSLHCPHSRPSL